MLIYNFFTFNMKFEDKVLERAELYDLKAEKARQDGDSDLMEWFLGRSKGLREALKIFNDGLTNLEKLGRNLN